MSDDEERIGYELMVPFVACASNGGPYEDVPFVAGFEMGKLWAWCSALKGADQATFVMTIRAENRDQADLIAMNFGARINDVPPMPSAEIRSIAPGAPPEWCTIEVTWALRPGDR